MAKKDTSPNKIEANRRNAKKSTGPRSAAGKAKSSRNAVKHGLLAGRIVLADNAEEDPQQFGLLLDGLRDDYQPQSTIETMLVERLAASFWRLRRAYRFEVETITQANRPNPLADALDEMSPLPPVKRGERILPAPHSLDRLIRYETMIDRELLRTMRQLDLRQRLRKMGQAPQPRGKQHGQEYLPMPPARSVPRPCATALERCARPEEPLLESSGTPVPLPPDPAKAPAPNEPTAAPSAGPATRCERRSSSAGPIPPAACHGPPRRIGRAVAAGVSAGRRSGPRSRRLQPARPPRWHATVGIEAPPRRAPTSALSPQSSVLSPLMGTVPSCRAPGPRR